MTGPTPLEPLRRLPSRPPEGVLFSQSPGRYLREITARSMPRRVPRQGHHGLPRCTSASRFPDPVTSSSRSIFFFLRPINFLQPANQPHSFLRLTVFFFFSLKVFSFSFFLFPHIASDSPPYRPRTLLFPHPSHTYMHDVRVGCGRIIRGIEMVQGRVRGRLRRGNSVQRRGKSSQEK